MQKLPFRLSTILWMLGAAALALELRRAWRKRRQPQIPEPPPAAAPEPSPAEGAPPAASEPPHPPPMRFTKVLVLIGILLGLVVVGDLVVRGFKREIEPPVWETSEANTDLGRAAIIKHGCGGCHVIPGIRHATGRVGPQLAGFREQMYIGGMLANVPANLEAWLQNPQKFSPGTAMPNLNVTPEEARAISIYLYAQP